MKRPGAPLSKVDGQSVGNVQQADASAVHREHHAAAAVCHDQGPAAPLESIRQGFPQLFQGLVQRGEGIPVPDVPGRDVVGKERPGVNLRLSLGQRLQVGPAALLIVAEKGAAVQEVCPGGYRLIRNGVPIPSGHPLLHHIQLAPEGGEVFPVVPFRKAQGGVDLFCPAFCLLGGGVGRRQPFGQ